ncbi:MAG: hypothetical protein ABIG89_03045 [Candidatus Woesearchaeota archaeon]
MNNKPILIEANNCDTNLLNNDKKLLGFLNEFHLVTDSLLLAKPSLVNRSGTEAEPSYSGFIATSDYHLSFSTYFGHRKIVLFILSDHDSIMNTNNIVKHIAYSFSIDLKSIKLRPVDSNTEEFIECEESKCIRKASRIWGGRLVCKDHYEEYQNKQVDIDYDEHNY